MIRFVLWDSSLWLSSSKIDVKYDNEYITFDYIFILKIKISFQTTILSLIF